MNKLEPQTFSRAVEISGIFMRERSDVWRSVVYVDKCFFFTFVGVPGRINV